MRREQLQKEYTETREQGEDGTEITTASWPDGSAVRTMVPPQGAPVITVTAPRGHFGRHESEHGPYISTPGARKLDQTDLLEALGRFRAGDWGDACEEDREMNDLSRSGGEGVVMGVYSSGDREFWIHEPVGEEPTVLLPEEH